MLWTVMLGRGKLKETCADQSFHVAPLGFFSRISRPLNGVCVIYMQEVMVMVSHWKHPIGWVATARASSQYVEG